MRIHKGEHGSAEQCKLTSSVFWQYTTTGFNNVGNMDILATPSVTLAILYLVLVAYEYLCYKYAVNK